MKEGWVVDLDDNLALVAAEVSYELSCHWPTALS